MLKDFFMVFLSPYFTVHNHPLISFDTITICTDQVITTYLLYVGDPGFEFQLRDWVS